MLRALHERHSIPLKVAYLGEGSQIWNAVASDPDYDLGQRELATLRAFLPEAGRELRDGPWNIVHLGSGNGIEAPFVVEALGPSAISRYVIVDISASLLSLARAHLKKGHPHLRVSPRVEDLDVANLARLAADVKRGGAPRTLFLLVANGALAAESRLLERLPPVLGRDDRLLFTVELFEEGREEEILRSYRLPSMARLFRRQLRQVAIAAVPDDALHFYIDRERHLVRIDLLRRAPLHYLWPLGSVEPTPSPIHLFRSFRPTRQHFPELFLRTGLRIVTAVLPSATRCGAALCAPRA
ncbi:MAG: L-histidine N(alpha)-methyltransferase [Deltaproteobacteria bacterium]|nr:L-histidine N(alpha)-methyltransferase [Deltaproteobacteria bacterium]